MADNGLTPADYRRAMALVTHRASEDYQDLYEGVRAIFDEAIEHNRLTRLLVAVDESYRVWAFKLRSDEGRKEIDELIDSIAHDHEDRYTKLAAEAIVAIRVGDDARFQAIMAEVNNAAPGGTGARLIGAIADIYQHLLPELATPDGRAGLQELVLKIAAEDTGD